MDTIKARDFLSVERGKRKEEGVYSIIASTKAVDRMGEIVEPTGCANLERFLKGNPIILWSHNWSLPPIGKAIRGEINDNELRLDIKFAQSAFAQEVKSLYDEGILNAFSIGFMPLEVGEKSIDNVKHRVYNKWDLLETSCVDVPANEEALIIRSALEHGMSLKALTELLAPSATPRQMAETGDRRSGLIGVADKWLEHRRRK